MNIFCLRRKDREKDSLTPEKVLHRILIALVQVKAGNTFENLLNEICQIIYPLHQAN